MVKSRYTIAKWNGDDQYSWAVFHDNKVITNLTGLSKNQADYHLRIARMREGTQYKTPPPPTPKVPAPKVKKVVQPGKNHESYPYHYNRGWRASARPTPSLDRADKRHEPEAWYDGYFDYAAGREKWHLMYCPDHDKCG